MDCCELEQLLPAFADGEFEGAERAEAEAHLAVCSGCLAEVEAQLAFQRFVREKARPGTQHTAPALLRGRIHRTVARERSLDQARRFVSYSAVAAGLVAVASAGYVVASPEGGPARGMIAEAIDKHRRALPIEVRPVHGKVDAWFDGKVDFRVHAPRFRSASSPQLVGARLANVRDREAAYLVYGDEPARRMTLLLFPGGDYELPDGERTRIGDRDVVVANENGYNVALWESRGIVYSLVSELDERDVLKLVADVDDR